MNNKYNFPAALGLAMAVKPARVVNDDGNEGGMEGLKFKHPRIGSGGGHGCNTKGKKKTFPRRRS